MFRRRFLSLATAAIFATGALAAGTTAASAQSITVGGKNFTEQLLMAEMTTLYLEDNGYDVSKRDGMGSAVLRRAQENAQIDLYWEYVGTSLIVYNEVEGGEEMEPDEAYETVKDLDAEKGLVWLEPSDANNTYAMAMREDHAEELGLETLSELIEHMEEEEVFSLGVNAEWAARPDGLPGFQEHYDFTWARGDVRRMETGLIYPALRDGDVDLGVVFATDGRIDAFEFRVLEDDKAFFPNYAMTPVVRQDTLEANPELEDLLNRMSEHLDDDTMQTLNRQVDVDGRTIEEVAQSFLEEEGLI